MIRVFPLIFLLVAQPLWATSPTGVVDVTQQPHPSVAAAWLPLSQSDEAWKGVRVVHEASGEALAATLRREEKGTVLLWSVPGMEVEGETRFRYTLEKEATGEAPALEANLLDAGALTLQEGSAPLPGAINAELATVEERAALVLGIGEEKEPGFSSARFRVEPGLSYRVSFDYLLKDAPLHPNYGLSLYVWLYYLDEEGHRTRIPLKETTILHRASLLTSDETNTDGWKSRHYQVVIPKGVQLAELDFRAAAGGQRAVALSRVRVAPVILARARDEAMLAQEKAGGRFFDFGPEGSAVFDRFEAVSPKDSYTPDRGWGFSGMTDPAAFDSGRPEALGRDVISAKKATFRVDLPDGNYDLWLLSGDVSTHQAVRRYYFNSQLRVNGKELWTEQETPAEILMRGLYDGYDKFWLPGADYYNDFVVPRFREFTTSVEVKEGRLLVEWENLPLGALVILPKKGDVALQTVVEGIAAERRRDTVLHEVPAPADKEGDWSPNAQEKERGFALYHRPVEEPRYPYARPVKGSDRLERLESFGTPGEVVPLWFTLHGLEDKGTVELEALALEGEAGRIEAGALKVGIARYLFWNAGAKGESGGYRYQVRALPLDHPRPVPIRKGLNWSWWVNVEVPKGTPAGVYSGHLRLKEEGGAETLLPVRLRVLGFELEPLPIVQGFYYKPSEPWYAFFWHRNVYGADLKKEALELRDLIIEQERRELAAMRTLGVNSVAFGDDLRGDLRFEDGKISLIEGDRFTLWMNLYKEAGFGPMPFYGMTPYGPTPGTPNRLSWLDDSLKPPFTPAWYAAYAELVEMLEVTRRKNDWPEILYYISDERSNYGQPGADLGAEVAASLKEVRKRLGIRTIASLNGPYERVMVPHLDLSMPNYAFPINEESVRFITDSRSAFWIYNVGKQRLTQGLWTWAMKAGGRFQWHYRSHTAYTWDDVANPSREQTAYSISYPTPKGPIFTLDGEEARAGITDHRYLATLEAAIAAAKGNRALEEARAEAEQFLADLRERLPVDARRLIESDDPKEAGGEIRHGLNGSEALERVRWGLATHILKLQGGEEGVAK